MLPGTAGDSDEISPHLVNSKVSADKKQDFCGGEFSARFNSFSLDAEHERCNGTAERCLYSSIIVIF